MKQAFCVVAVLALACLLLRSARVGLAGDYVDPISRVKAQDESLYAHSAIRIAKQGGWLTPLFMGRYALYKPPMLMWAAGLSTRILGVSRLALRLPVALLCCMAVALVFLWAAELRSWQAGASAALLMASNHLWHVLGGMSMTDGLLAAFYVAAMYSLFSDPWLESKSSFWGFTAAVAAAILTKGLAGVLPLGVLGLYWLAGPRKQRPAFPRVCAAAALSLALAAPWFAYQMMAHGRWFWAEHIGVEILGFGAGAPPQASLKDPQMSALARLANYFVRLAAVDPVLTAIALAAFPGFWSALRRRLGPAILLGSWIAIMLAALLVWQYRNITYLLPLIPALAILAAAHGPYSSVRSSTWMLILLGVAFGAKAAFPNAPWGISFGRGTVQAAAPMLSGYCDRARANELILVDIDDDLYASTLPLSKLRYSVVGAYAAGREFAMPFDYLGIAVTPAEFNDLTRWEPVFRQRLREWGLDSGEPIASLIRVESPGELAAMIRAHPNSDFLISASFRSAVPSSVDETHEIVDTHDHLLLLSRNGHTRNTPLPWSCHL